MIYRDLRSAGEALGCSLSYRRSLPGGEDRIDDMAQAWIDGRHEEVLQYVAEHVEIVRARIDLVKKTKGRGRPRSVDTACVERMLGSGHTWKETSEQCGCSLSSISRVIARNDKP